MHATSTRAAILFLGLALGLAGCSDDSSPEPADSGAVDATVGGDGTAAVDGAAGDAGQATAAFKQLEPYDGFKGTATITCEASPATTKVELLADGAVVATATEAPFDLSWDTTAASDGATEISLKAHGPGDPTTCDAVPVVVYNNGEVVTFDDGDGTATMTIDPAVDSHIKFHWTMADGFSRVLAAVLWDNPEFKMELAVGTGGCPHSGELAAKADADATPLAVEFAPGGTLASTMWFAHVGATNEADLTAKSSGLTIKAYVFK